MGKDLVDLTFFRESANEPWGFRLAGGKDYGQPLSISQVSSESLAAKVGLTANDFLISIAGREVYDMTHEQAEKTIMNAGNKFAMVIERVMESGRKISFEKSATTFQLKLKGSGGVAGIQKKDEAFISNVPITEDTPMLIDGSVNFKKYEKKAADLSASKTLEDVAKKANQRKDWNCPWVKKDGSGLKQAIRYIDEPSAPAKTSVKHYYSEPKSILGNEKELTREELEAIIKEHGAESRPESRMSQGSRPQSRAQKQQQMGTDMYQQESTMEMQEQEMRREDHTMFEKKEQQQSFSQQRVNFVADDQETYFREREDDSQAPPDLEPVEVQQGFQLGGMGQFGDEGYEPSADELIDVLKNLENLAAGNPALYRSIVDQIKGSTQVVFDQTKQSSSAGYYQESTQMNGNTQQYEQEMYEQQMFQQQQQESELYQQQMDQQQMQMQMQQQLQQQMYEEQSMMSQQTTMTQQTTMQTQESYSQQQVEEQMSKMNMSQEEFKQHQKMKRLEAEAQEEVRQTLAKQREAKMRKLHPPEPPKPKEIVVIAGDGKSVKVQLGGEPVEDSRKQVAEAAGLKHVPLPDFDATENSAWAGSLKKTSKVKIQQGRGEEMADDENPWAGSLRHVNDKPSKGTKKAEKDDLYGGAPWMGTLRHVVHDNKVTRNYGVNQHQSKRYPDEDAGNPFESTGGSNARPAFPLTPAAIINGSLMSRDEMARREEDEEVARIRSNIGSKTVSTALLQVLMPKLLKMHETKYSPMEKADAEKIMSEILGMQCGLNPDQQADANEEAEMIIRAIMQDEVDKSIYSKMADDLESASKRMKTMKKNKVKKVTANATEITA
eukprot:GFUD01138324.1.p1 GENE.GFUD01138324.1~~GFUD01138324.1.p1  ORF type:complete len:835 (+),score=281.66 GFUD01138324.1:236-2740(+)